MALTINAPRGYSSQESLRERLVTPRFAGLEAFRLHVVLIALAPLTLGSILVDGLPVAPVPSVISFAALVSLASAVLFFLVAGRITDAVFTRESFQRTVVILAVFGATEAIRTIVFSQLIVSSGAPLEMVMPHRLLGGSMTGMLVLGITALISVDRDRYFAEYARLSDRQTQLSQELEALNYTISRFVNDLTTNVREVVDTALRSLASTHSGKSAKEVVDEIVNVSENVVRPLSQEVLEALPKQSDGRLGEPKVSLRRVLYLATVVAPFQPVAMPLVIFMLFFSASVFIVSPNTGLLLLTLIVSGVWLCHVVGARVLQPRMLNWATHWRVIVTTLMYSAGSFVSLAVILFSRGSGAALDRLGTILYVHIIVAVLSWGLATIPAIREGQREVIADMHETTASLMQVRARNEVRLRRDKQRLSSLIHGDIQATLMATALKVQQGNYTGDALVEVINDIREHILSRFEQGDDADTRRTMASVQDDLNQFWDGLLTLSWNVSPQVHTVVDRDDDLPEMLFQVLREAITNAAKHGRAQSVMVSVHIDSETHIVCRVADDGVPQPKTEHPGVGTQFFNAVADTVSRHHSDEGTVLTLRMPLPQTSDVGLVK